MKWFPSKFSWWVWASFVFVLILLVLGLRNFLNEDSIKTKAVSLPSSSSFLPPSPSVKSILSVSKRRNISLKVSGISEPDQFMEIESQLSGTVKRIFVKEGDRVKKGVPILCLKDGERPEKLEAAKKLLKLREMQCAAARKLADKNFTSPISLADAEKNLSDARLAVTQAQLNMGHLWVRAPFSGIVNKLLVEDGEVLSHNKKVAEIVNLNPLYFVLYVTEKVYSDLKLGSRVHVLTSNGEKLSGKIDYISPLSDPKTRMFKVKVSIPNPGSKLPSGMTCEVTLSLGEHESHQLNPSWLTLSKDGIVGVMGLQNGKSIFYPVHILDSSPSAVYVSGLPKEIEIIVLGQESVSDVSVIQSVRPSSNDGLQE
ncbi:MAG: efflux RND transporter periplasmic adaptor subunit [Alphaproteobacteria bacterium]